MSKDEVLRCTHDIAVLHQPELAAWVESLGVDPATIRDEFVIVMGEREYELHLTEYITDGAGRRVLDRAKNDVVTRPLIVPLGTDESWPTLGLPQACRRGNVPTGMAEPTTPPVGPSGVSPSPDGSR